jgi:hypothetical protein
MWQTKVWDPAFPSAEEGSLRPYLPCSSEKLRYRKWYRRGLTKGTGLVGDPGRHHTEIAYRVYSVAKC